MRQKVLYVNTPKADCSIHESGRMMFECLHFCQTADVDYIEVDPKSRTLPEGYDCYAFNYHPFVMEWLDTASLRRFPGLKLCFILETRRNAPFAWCPEHDFDAYCAIDPSMRTRHPNVFAFPRPLEAIALPQSTVNHDIPTIGSFGFPTRGKCFEKIVAAAATEFERAIVRINLPKGTFVSSGFDEIVNRCHAECRDGIDLRITRDFMTKQELIAWCGENTLNCFLYDRDMSGLAATTDQAISSGRPLLVSGNETFRHIHQYIKPYPLQNFREAIASTAHGVQQMQRDWAPEKFAARFDEVLQCCLPLSVKNGRSHQPIELPIKDSALTKALRNGFISAKGFIGEQLTPPIVKKVARKLLRRNGSHATLNEPGYAKAGSAIFIHPGFGSFSRNEEDFILEELFSHRSTGTYLDIGGNDPVFNNNTYRFYKKGWRGVNVELDPQVVHTTSDRRPLDVTIHTGGKVQIHSQALGDAPVSPPDKEISTGTPLHKDRGIEQNESHTIKLGDLIRNHFGKNSLDILSIATEISPLEILCSNDWAALRPVSLVIKINARCRPVHKFLGEQCYSLVYQNSDNAIFVDLYSTDDRVRAVLDKLERCSEDGSASGPALAP